MKNHFAAMSSVYVCVCVNLSSQLMNAKILFLNIFITIVLQIGFSNNKNIIIKQTTTLIMIIIIIILLIIIIL